MNSPAIHLSATKTRALRYLSCLRPQDIVVLQGPPLLGAAFAFHHPSAQNLLSLAVLTVANVLLIAHIFTLNDWAGLATDLADANKAGDTFAARGIGRREIGTLTLILLIVGLSVFCVLGTTTFALALAIVALSALYSLPRFNWKGKPLLSSGAHLAGGIMHFLLGYSLGSALDRRGIAIATFFALIFTAGHLTQELRDYQGDATNAIRTNAVTFGRLHTFVASLVLFALAHVLLLLLSWTGIVARPLAALTVLYLVQVHWSLEAMREGLSFASVSRLQQRYRALYAVIGLAMVVALVLAPGS
jgi:4-hydroxybenzoate polyprenyltransferase